MTTNLNEWERELRLLMTGATYDDKEKAIMIISQLLQEAREEERRRSAAIVEELLHQTDMKTSETLHGFEVACERIIDRLTPSTEEGKGNETV